MSYILLLYALSMEVDYKEFQVQLRKKYKDPSIQIDLVSCQFAFHYCFESLQQAECMMKNASECLRTGGYFIGTIPDAYDIVYVYFLIYQQQYFYFMYLS